jgi:1,6-anhydro-N-acetylmuramate kinase
MKRTTHDAYYIANITNRSTTTLSSISILALFCSPSSSVSDLKYSAVLSSEFKCKQEFAGEGTYNKGLRENTLTNNNFHTNYGRKCSC